MKVLPLHPTQTNINMLHSYQLKPVLLLSALFIFLQMQAQKYVGGDISLLPSYVENGAKYYEHGGNAIADPLAFFKAEGMNVPHARQRLNDRKGGRCEARPCLRHPAG